jgi:methionyl-tRNA synthetase
VNYYDLRAVGEVAVELARFGNEYIQRNEPWNLVDEEPARAETVIRDCVQIAKACAVLVQPVMPVKAERLWGQLNEAGSVADVPLDEALEAPPESLDEPRELFEQVEDDQVEALTEQLEARVQAAAPDDEASADEDGAVELEPVLEERISIEDFEQLDLRVGEITDADPIPEADELLRLSVDIGVETRQVVAGLARLHDVEALPGTRVILLANVEPVELFGVESNGMVLAAGDEADLLTTQGDAALGTRIR